MNDPSTGFVWGGIFGAVFGAFLGKMVTDRLVDLTGNLCQHPVRCKTDGTGDLIANKLGITWETKKSLIPRYSIDGRNEFNFGFFRPDGAFLTKNATWALTDLGLRHLGEKYIRNISSIVPGSEINDQGNVCINGRILNVSDLYGTEEAITKVIADFIADLQTETSEME